MGIYTTFLGSLYLVFDDGVEDAEEFDLYGAWKTFRGHGVIIQGEEYDIWWSLGHDELVGIPAYGPIDFWVQQLIHIYNNFLTPHHIHIHGSIPWSSTDQCNESGTIYAHDVIKLVSVDEDGEVRIQEYPIDPQS